jgi:hypothetical protein
VQLGMAFPTTAGDAGEKELTRLLTQYNIHYTSISETKDEYLITLNPKQQIVITRKKDISSQISSLQVLLPRLTMEGREFRRLDLRFNKPVVTY